MAEETQKSESGLKAFGAVVGSVVLIAVGCAAGWFVRDMTPEKPKAPTPQMLAMAKAAAMPPTVAVTNAQLRAYNLAERYVAHAEPVQEVDLLPQVDGYVKEILFKEGDLVKEGQILYVLDDERYQAVVNQRKADLAAAEAESRRAERYWERMQKADARGITQKERDDAEAGAEKTKAAVIQAQANLVVAEYDLKKAKVVAPISGQIGKTTAHKGDYVAPSKGALARIVQIDPIRVSFPLTDRAYVGWREAQKKGTLEERRLRLLLPNGSEYDQTGTWDFDDNQMSRETATIMMRLSFPNPDRLLVPNSYVTLLADYLKPPEFPCIPQQALVELPGGNQGVFVLKDDMTVEQRPVKVGEPLAGWVPLMEGVKADEKVVIGGIAKLGPGMKVALAQATDNDDLTPGYKSPIEERK